jgi:hypothetical protein
MKYLVKGTENSCGKDDLAQEMNELSSPAREKSMIFLLFPVIQTG